MSPTDSHAAVNWDIRERVAVRELAVVYCFLSYFVKTHLFSFTTVVFWRLSFKSVSCLRLVLKEQLFCLLHGMECNRMPAVIFIAQFPSQTTLQRSLISANRNCELQDVFCPMFVVLTETSACSSNPCQNGGKCDVNGNNFVCSCRSGYSGTLCGNYAAKPNYLLLMCDLDC